MKTLELSVDFTGFQNPVESVVFLSCSNIRNKEQLKSVFDDADDKNKMSLASKNDFTRFWILDFIDQEIKDFYCNV